MSKCSYLSGIWGHVFSVFCLAFWFLSFYVMLLRDFSFFSIFLSFFIYFGNLCVD